MEELDFELEQIEDVHEVDLEGDNVIIFDMETAVSRAQIEHFKEQLEDAGLNSNKAVIVSGLSNLYKLKTRGDEDVGE